MNVNFQPDQIKINEKARDDLLLQNNLNWV